MPPQDRMLVAEQLRVGAYGAAKTRKTWWALMAANAGFNVILADGDKGRQIMSHVPQEAHKRIHVIDCNDTLEMNSFSNFCVRIVGGQQFIWDETERDVLNVYSRRKPGRWYALMDFNKATFNDVLILDSWTAFVQSLHMQFAKENKIELEDATKVEWEGYRWTGALASYVISKLKALKCHVIVIAHQDQYEKRKPDGKTIDWSRLQFKSTSGNHALQLAAYFSDILYYKFSGRSIKIDTNSGFDRDGGCRNAPPGIYDWEELQFIDLIKNSGNALPDPEHKQQIVKFFPGEITDEELAALGVRGAGVKQPAAGAQGDRQPAPVIAPMKSKTTFGALLDKSKK